MYVEIMEERLRLQLRHAAKVVAWMVMMLVALAIIGVVALTPGCGSTAGVAGGGSQSDIAVAQGDGGMLGETQTSQDAVSAGMDTTGADGEVGADSWDEKTEVTCPPSGYPEQTVAVSTTSGGPVCVPDDLSQQCLQLVDGTTYVNQKEIGAADDMEVLTVKSAGYVPTTYPWFGTKPDKYAGKVMIGQKSSGPDGDQYPITYFALESCDPVAMSCIGDVPDGDNGERWTITVWLTKPFLLELNRWDTTTGENDLKMVFHKSP